MKKEDIKRLALAIFVCISVLMILIQLITGVKYARNPAEKAYKEEFVYDIADTLPIHPDSLWGQSEFTNNR